ncbi:glycosyltransferase family 25 protein [Rhizobium sp. LC145]|uniref:glycosyltransferase family 25 protein n=1 Tax=Rhizobium sp. LC145 TaxID=1120688 RepID=UPI000629FA8C|nr:glycosyltransferase family 25 protein [Rhizobium sp. LC145]KKX32986.1 hypothetical protein YH62_05405 [Rhizobium sp. LC145]
MLNVLVLSLPSADGRRRASRAELGRYGMKFEFFDALDGERLPQEIFGCRYDAATNARAFKRPLSAGEISCYLGHLQMWSHLVESGAKATLILEDDFEFTRDPVTFLNEIAGYDLSNVIVKLDGNAPRRSRRLQQIGDTWLVTNSLLPPRTTGYIIGAGPAAILLERRKRFFRPVDIDLKCHWEHRVPILVTEKALIRERQHNVSSLENARAENKPSTLTRFWRNLSYQAAFRWGIRTAGPYEIAQLKRKAR